MEGVPHQVSANRRANRNGARPWAVAVLMLACCACTDGAHAEPVRTAYSQVDLIAEQATLPAGGGTVTIGLHIEPDPAWHAYWINAGDAGLPATMRWELPDGFSASELQFPAPHVIPFGELITYAFEEPILLLSDIGVPPGLAPGTSVTLQGLARWVVCDDELCVPERASLSVSLNIGDGDLDPLQAERFAAARAKLPERVDWPAHFEVLGDEVRIAVQTPPSAAPLRDPYLFVAQRHVVEYARQTPTASPRGTVFSLDAGRKADAATDFAAVVQFENTTGAERAVWIQVQPASETAAPPGSGADTAAGTAAGSPAGGLSLAAALLFAFIGGVILNLMPCVFPILSMKALSLVSMGQTDHRVARDSGLLYTAGILAAFTLIGGVLVGLREAGQAVGWGFHLQSPFVNLGLGLLMLAIAMNLLGVFEFGTRAAGIGQSLTADGERRAAFFTGLLAVVVATPCTAPFMAGALGYALVQTTPVALSIFLALGFGLAFPYLLISLVPAFGRIMPRPGPWMAHFRSILAFPMFATAVWLFWIMGKQLGVNSMAVGLLAALFLAFALWAYGQVFGGTRPWAWRSLAALGLIVAVATGARIEDYRIDPVAPADGHAGTLGQLSLEHFTPERLAGYVDSGEPVFVYFTADWCVNCKLNERVALASDAVGAAFHERGIKVLEGDWTNEDPTITAWLDRYGRVGVPLYLYFPAGSSLADAAVLPQILLPDIVIDAIDRADGIAG